MLPVIAVYLRDLRKVCLAREHIFDSATVVNETVSRDLETVFFRHAVTQIGEECIRGSAVTLADCVCRNQLRLCVHRNEHPCVPKFVRVFHADIALFLRYERPNFVP